MPAWLMQFQSVLIVLSMTLGIHFAKQHQAQKHIKLMSFSMIWDVILILQIELSRGAINKAAKAMVNPWPLNIHVSFAVVTVLFYGAMVYSGAKLQDKAFSRAKHKRLGQITYLLRILTLITSFWAVKG